MPDVGRGETGVPRREAPEGASQDLEVRMSDFVDQISTSVRAARESTIRQREAQGRNDDGETGRQPRNRERASELLEPIWDRIGDAVAACDGAITRERKHGSAGTTFRLRWQEIPPDRSLQIVVDERAGRIEASWVVVPGYGSPVDAPSIEASALDIAHVESAIQLLVDQSLWSGGMIPMIPW